MRIVFCNTTYLRYYDGRIAGELKPKTGGRWVQENEDAHEKWNFLNMDGYCYGFVQANADNIHIERIDASLKRQEKAEDVTVIWCAKHPVEDKTVIVGWYENATMYRHYQETKSTPLTGLEKWYQFKTNAENAYLLPEDKRTVEIGRASKTGPGTGFSQSNYWFADLDYAKENIIPAVLEFIEKNKECRINLLKEDFEPPTEMIPVTAEEVDGLGNLDDLSDLEYLPLGYRMYNQYGRDAEGAYLIAKSLRNLHQYSMSIDWFKEVIELDPEDWFTKGELAYVYSQCELHEESIKWAKIVLEELDDKDPAYREEIYCLIADEYYLLNNTVEAIKWLERILMESKNKELIAHTNKVMKNWNNQ